ncbi:HlyD family efflux transporter periplasmic adaptor subunit [bacterium]|nr:HlyD family efflux transporter periplasmic adaptor subunit [bacterium]
MLACTALIALVACSSEPGGHADAEYDDRSGEHAGEIEARGPNGGKLLREGSLAIEITIFERGVPPEYRLYPYWDGEPIAPDQLDAVNAEVVLTRLDGETNRFAFTPQGDFLRGDGVVTEPHSFDVAVSAAYRGTQAQWGYDSHEGRVQIAAGMAQRSGISTQTAGPGTVHETLTLYGRITPDPARVAAVRARFPGLIRSVSKSVGDAVTRGEALVSVEADDSLRRYTLAAPIDGVIVERMASAAEVAGSDPLLTIADYSTVWAQLAVFPKQFGAVKVGQRVTVYGDDVQTQGVIDWLTPAGHNGPSRDARVVLDNPDGRWAPGTTVRAEVVTDSVDADLVVQNSALQAFRDFTVVFAKVGDTYEVRMLDLGRSDGEVTQVLGGLKPGTEYVTGNSYLIKADIEKSGASHDH